MKALSASRAGLNNPMIQRAFRHEVCLWHHRCLPWPRCAASYTVGPQVYHVTFFPFSSKGTNTSFRFVRVLYSVSS